MGDATVQERVDDMGRADGVQDIGPNTEAATIGTVSTLLAQRAKREGTANVADAVNFLMRMNRRGPWLLVAIHPDKKQGIQARHCRTLDDAKEFIETFGRTHNLYFHPNGHHHEANRKAKRTEIHSLRCYWVDIDPRGNDLEAERERIYKLIVKQWPDAVPLPTLIIDSGNGFQILWKLEQPVTLDLTEDGADKAADPNRWLEEQFGADDCHNIDRILRLPFTNNIPDSRKAGKGRTRVVSSLMFENLDNTVKPSDFRKPTKVSMHSKLKHVSTEGVNVDDASPVLDLDELDVYDITQETKIAIAQGKGEKPKEKDNSRSAWLFHVVSELVRKRVPDSVIYSIITDPEWGISESVRDNKRGARDYAMRQIARAKVLATEPELDEMNAKHAVIRNYQGKCLVLTEQPDPEDPERTKHTYQSFADFKNAYGNRFIEVEGKAVKLGQWWLTHPKRREYETVCFIPGKETPGHFNLWQGFAYEPKAGKIDYLIEHIYETLSADDHVVGQYIENWIASMYQRPWENAGAAIVLFGKQGTGKSFFVNAIGKPLGEHYMQITQTSHLTGKFNSHLERTLFLFSDEAVYAGDPKNESPLKALITESKLAIERKGIDVRQQTNYLHIMMATNKRHAVPVGAHDRRFLITEVSDRNQNNRALFNAMAKRLNNGGYEALLQHFLTKDIAHFEPGNIPKTDLWRENVILSMSNREAWWHAKLVSGDITTPGSGWPEMISSDELALDHFEENALTGSREFKNSKISLGWFIRDAIGRESQKMTYEGKQQMVYLMPSLDACRARWCDKFGDLKFGPNIKSVNEIRDAF